MPITPSYIWQESPTWVTIHVALRSVSPGNVDILTTECYVKVNCSPYLFQIDLFGDIEINKSSAIVDNGTVWFFLVKKQECLWGRLNALGERKEILLKREKSLESNRQRTNELKAAAKVKAAQLGRLAVQSQMKLDEGKRKLVEERKAAELKWERDTIELWQKKFGDEPYSKPRCLVQDFPSLEMQNGTDPANVQCPDTKLNTHEDESFFKAVKLETASNRRCNTGQNRDVNKSYASEDSCIAMLEATQKTKLSNLPNSILPAPREHVSVSVKFTPKSLSVNLPARESRDKVRLKEKSVTNSNTIDISEREPLFLQDKGDSFYMKGNFRSAINAYTDALQKDSTLLLCFANRAACFLQLKQFKACIEDCTAALQLLKQKEADIQEVEQQLLLNPSKSGHMSMMEAAFCDACTKAFDIGVMKFLIQECFKLLCYKVQSKEESLSTWYNLARRKILVRRGTALCNVAEFKKAKVDFEEVLSFDLGDKQVEEMSCAIHEFFQNVET